MDRNSLPLEARVRDRITKGIPRSLWDDVEVMYEAYELRGNVMSSGGDMAKFAPVSPTLQGRN